jgi:hypothetical protein
MMAVLPPCCGAVEEYPLTYARLGASHVAWRRVHLNLAVAFDGIATRQGSPKRSLPTVPVSIGPISRSSNEANGIRAESLLKIGRALGVPASQLVAEAEAELAI